MVLAVRSGVVGGVEGFSVCSPSVSVAVIDIEVDVVGALGSSDVLRP